MFKNKMNKKLKYTLLLSLLACLGIGIYVFVKKSNPNPNYKIGQKLDSLNGVYVYYNGGVSHAGERNVAADGYNIGLKYQCVEFVKRYYYQFYKHKMPDSYGNAKDFFNGELSDSTLNLKRALIQFINPSKSKPQVGDLIIFNGHSGNPFGHVAIVSKVNENHLEIIQQNPGPFASSRVNLNFLNDNKKFKIEHDRILGWLRMVKTVSN